MEYLEGHLRWNFLENVPAPAAFPGGASKNTAEEGELSEKTPQGLKIKSLGKTGRIFQKKNPKSCR